MLPIAMHIASILLATVLLVIGVLFVARPQMAFKVSGHEEAAAASVLGGRNAGLAIFILGLLAMGDFKALALAFAIGAGFGFFDAVVTVKAGGSPRNHLVAGSIAAVLAVYYFAGVPALEG
jgi:hypothetical protein